MRTRSILLLTACSALFISGSAIAGPVVFSTGAPDGLIATASRPASNGKNEIETADDFIFTGRTRLDSATFTGLLTGGVALTDVTRVAVDIYRVFPNESDTARTITVPTRTNSPGDVELVGRDSIDGNLSFNVNLVNASFTAANSVLNGIHAAPNQTTGGEGAVTGQEVTISITFTNPLNLPADHYFFRPEVEVSNGEFYWLSAAKPIGADGTPFAPDLQSWTRNTDLLPDWVRIGTDVVGVPAAASIGHDGVALVAPTFNASFSLAGQSIPLPAALWPGLGTLVALGAWQWRRTIPRDAGV